MNRPAVAQVQSASSLGFQSKLSLVVVALLSGALVSSALITGDSISVSSGETLPQCLLILLTALMASAIGWNVLPIGRDRPLPTCLLAIGFTWLVISCMAATLRADGRATWNSFWHVTSLLLFTTVLTQATQRLVFCKALVQLIIAVCVFQSIFALHQYFISMPAARAEYLADPDAGLMKAGIEAPPGSEIRLQYENRLLGSFEPIGTFALTNSLAALLSGTIMALSMWIWSQRRAPQRLALSTGALICLLMIGVWLLTKSRSGYLAVALVAIGWTVWHQLKRRTTTMPVQGATPSLSHSESPSNASSGASSEAPSEAQAIAVRTRGRSGWLIGAVLAIGLMGIAIGGLANDSLVVSEAPKSILYRLEYWQATAKMILDYPWTGVGLGNFQSYYPAYKLPAASEAIADPHNWLFDLAANCSVPFLIVCVLALMAVLRRTAITIGQSSADVIRPNEFFDKACDRAVWIGAATAFLLIAFLQLLFGELIDLDATALGLLGATGMTLCLHPLQTSPAVLRRGACAAMLTMLVCLLASGSWQASGMALPLGAWIAICCPSDRPIQSLSLSARSSAAKAGLALTTLTVAIFVWQTWQPVQHSWTMEQQAIASWQSGRPEAAIELAQAARDADRLASSPRRMLVQFRMDQALNSAKRGSAVEFTSAANQVDTALAELLESDPIPSLTYSYAGECNLALAAAAQSISPDLDPARVNQALTFYERAVARYPTNVALLAQVAAVRAWLDLKAGGPISAAVRDDLMKAYDLSQQTPHTNRKLESQQIFLPPPLSDRFAAEAISRADNRSPWVKAEPLCEFLRKL